MKKSIFVLGDSIAVQYIPYLKPLLENEFVVYTKRGIAEAAVDLNQAIGANGGSSESVLNYLQDEYRRGALHYDYLLLNCGLHDIKYDSDTQTHQVSLDAYRENLESIIAITAKAGTKLIWISTTPVDDERHNRRQLAFKRFNRDVLTYNQAASEIMVSHTVPLIDLYRFVDEADGEKYCDHVHYQEDMRKKQADFIYEKACEILSCL